eukprot:scaffold9948_cov129-Cylindrotheca_fusiformis.AAC.14
MKVLAFTALFWSQGTLAFAPGWGTSGNKASILNESPSVAEEVGPDDENSPFAPTPVPEVVAVNGWVPDDSKPCFGLPGVVAPTGYFDPIGFCQSGISLNDVKRYREAEVQHSRVAMLAVVGYLAGETIQGPFAITGPANDQLAQVPLPAFLLLTFGIGAAELTRAKIGWVEPTKFKSLWALRENYYPGDLGFDPLGLKPVDPARFADMQTRELQNGRLAMIGVAGFCSQELINHKTIFDTIDFYQKVYSGINPYESL